MKHLFTVLFCIVVNFSLNAQIKYKFNFEDGSEKTITMDYDDPTRMPLWNVNTSFCLFLVGNRGMASYRIQPEYRINDKMMIDASFCAPFKKSADESMSSNPEEQKLTMNLSGLFHYSLITSISGKKKKTAVDYGRSKGPGGGEAVYSAEIPRNIARTLVAMGGLNFFQQNLGSIGLKETQVVANKNYYTPNESFFSLCAGGSYYINQSYQLTTSGGSTRAYWRYFRAYGYLTYAIVSDMQTRMSTGSFSNGDLLSSDVETGFEKPELTRTGYRYGFEWHLAMMNSSKSLVIGFEIAQLPYFTFYNIQPKIHNNYAMIHIGMGIGQKVN